MVLFETWKSTYVQYMINSH